MRFRSLTGWPPRSADTNLQRLIQVLLAARRHPAYRQPLVLAGFESEQAIRGISSVGEALARIPPAPRWPVANRLRRPRHRLEPPRGSSPRTALFHAALKIGRSGRLFSPEEMRRVVAYRPEALAAPGWLLAEFARRIQSGLLPPLALRQYVAAFSGPAEGALAPDHRDLFWRVFQVPVFEQFLAFDGSLAAAECEAHDGLHVREDRAILEFARSEILLTSLTDLETPAVRVRTGIAADLLLSPCGCGEPGVRLAALRPLAAGPKTTVHRNGALKALAS
jgi:hypothetical protein